MNNVYRIIWNAALRVFQVCSELVRNGQGSAGASSVTAPRTSVNETPFLLSVKLSLSARLVRCALALTLGMAALLPVSVQAVVYDQDTTISGAETLNDDAVITSDATITVAGRGASVSAPGTSVDNGTLVVNNGAEYSAGEYNNSNSFFTVGSAGEDSDGKVIVDGQGSHLSFWGGDNRKAYIGKEGTGSFTLSNGSVVTLNSSGGATLVIGSAGGSGKLDIGNEGILQVNSSSWTPPYFVFGSDKGEGTLYVHDGGRIDVGPLSYGPSIRLGQGGKGTLLVEGENTYFSSQFITIGFDEDFQPVQGQGDIIIRDGATINIGWSIFAGPSGHVEVSGGGHIKGPVGTFNGIDITGKDSSVEGPLFIYSGTAHVNSGAKVIGVNGVSNLGVLQIGSTPNDIGGNISKEDTTVIIDGSGTLVRVPAVGLAGERKGSLSLSNQAQMDLEYIYDPYSLPAFVIYSVDGTEKNVQVSSGAVINAYITQDPGATVISGNGKSSLTVDSGGQFNGNDLNVSGEGDNQLVVKSGGLVNVGALMNGGDPDNRNVPDGSGRTLITGKGSQLNTRAISVSSGQLTVADGARASTLSESDNDNAHLLFAGKYSETSGISTSGDILVTGQGSLLETGGAFIGIEGRGSLTVADGGEVRLDFQQMPEEYQQLLPSAFLAAAPGVDTSLSSGTINIGAAAGQPAVAPGRITGTDSLTFGSGNGTLVFNHTDNSEAGYRFDLAVNAMTGLDHPAGRIDQQAGHTVLTAQSTLTGPVDVTGGILTLDRDASLNHIAALSIAAPGTVDIRNATTTGNGDYVMATPLSGSGVLHATLRAAQNRFSIDPAAGQAFTGTLALGQGQFALGGSNAAALTSATLQLDSGNTTTLSGTETRQLAGLTLKGGTLKLDDIPVPELARIHTTLLNAEIGTVQVSLPDDWTTPSVVPDSADSQNLLTQDDGNTGPRLISADSVAGSGGGLTLADQNGVVSGTQRDISQSGAPVATGTWGYRLTTEPGDGLYLNRGLTALDIHTGQTLALEPDVGTSGTAADMSAILSGAGNLTLRGGDGVVSLSNGNNRYQGSTTVENGTLRTDADNALGQTAALNVLHDANVDLNGKAQTVGALNSDYGTHLNLNKGQLTTQSGGLLWGTLSGEGLLSVAAGTLTLARENPALAAAVRIASGAEVSAHHTRGAGTGNIENNGILTLNGMSGSLANALSGSGAVNITNVSDVLLTGDNSGFSGHITTDKGSSLSISSDKNLGTAAITNHGNLTVNTATDGQMNNRLEGDGSLTKTGSGVLTLTPASAGYTGKTDITGGELVLGRGAAAPVDLQSSQVDIHDGAILSGYGSTKGDVKVREGGLLQVDFTVGGDLNNSGTVSLSRDGHPAGETLTVNGNYTGNNGLLALRTELGGDNAVTDKLTVKGDTSGTTRVKVTKAGGSGAQTLNGIEVIKVEGQSEGVFAQEGRIVAGAYDYALQQKGKNWYLNSSTTTEPGEPPVPVSRPENLSYAGNLRAANTLFSTTLHDRAGASQYTDPLTGERHDTSMWLRVNGGHNRSQLSDGQSKTQANRYVVQLGGDVAQWSRNGQDGYHLGLMGGYGNEHSRTENRHSGYDSRGQIHGYSAGVYGTWYQDEQTKSGAYVDSWMLYNRFGNSVSGEGLSAESYKSLGITASLETGYALKVGEHTTAGGLHNSVWLQPQAQVTWAGVHADDHTERNGTRVSAEGEDNVQTRLGMRAYLKGHSVRDAGKSREFSPYVEVNWLHNSRAYGVSMDGNSSHLDGMRNIAEMKTGVEAKVSERLHVWGNVAQQTGDKGYSDTSGTLGVKYQF